MPGETSTGNGGYANLTQYAYLHGVYLTGYEGGGRAITATEDKRYARAPRRGPYM